MMSGGTAWSTVRVLCYRNCDGSCGGNPKIVRRLSLSDGELFGSGCCPGSVRSVLCSSGITGLIFGKTVSPGNVKLGEESLEL